MCLTGAGQSQAKQILDDLSKHGVDIFATCGNDLSRLLALVGDSLRTNSDVTFPVPALWAKTHDILRMHLADNLVYTARAWAPAQHDRGNFEMRDTIFQLKFMLFKSILHGLRGLLKFTATAHG